MPDLSFQVDGAEAVAYAASPTLALKLRVTNASAEELVQSVMLQCQIRIEVTRRRYTPGEQEHLRDLFGEPQRWGHTLRSMLWTRTVALVPPFTGSATIDLQLPCTFDFSVAATKYFDSLKAGDIPLLLLFSGTVFYPDADGLLQVTQLPWEKEATFRLPVQVWKQMMDLYYPNTAWLCLRRDTFSDLHRYKSENSIPTWEQTIETLLQSAQERATP
jgi:hypothetical protein